MRRIRFRTTKFDKPPLGLPLGSSSLTQGLQIGAILNEFGTQGPNLASSTQPAQIHNILGRNNGVGTGVLGGASSPQSNWVNTKQGRGFENQSAGSAGAINFGAESKYQALTNFTVSIQAAWYVGIADQSHWVFNMYNGGAIDMGLIFNGTAAPVKWLFQINTAGGTVSVQFQPSHSTDGTWMDHLVFTYDGATLKGYMNGIFQTSSAGNAVSFTGTNLIQLTGSSVVGSSNSIYPVGHLYLWNRVLNAAEVQALYIDPYWSLIVKPRSWLAATASATPTTPFTYGFWGIGA